MPSGTHPPAAKPGTTSYSWDAQDRLLGVTLPDGSTHSYEYDYRTRRIGTSFHAPGSLPPAAPTKQTAIVFSGGLSVAEWETENGEPGTGNPPTVEYTRGPDMGGGVGGLLYSLRSETSGSGSSPSALSPTPRYNLSNGRGDIVAQSNQSAALTWTASYEAYGKRTKETGTNQDKQRGNSKDEDPTGLLNEGFRYRDLETGVWLSRDPAGFVDGPNLYAYVKQNPWTGWDPLGLEMDWHHDFPQNYESSFDKYDIDVHDSEYGTFMNREKHHELHAQKYNDHWGEKLKEVDELYDNKHISKGEARNRLLNHLDEIRNGNVEGFADYYQGKYAHRVGRGLHYVDDWEGNKSKERVIAASYEAAKGNKQILWKSVKEGGRKLIKFTLVATAAYAFTASQAYAKDELKMSNAGSVVWASIETVNPLPVSMEDAIELSKDNAKMAYARQETNRKSIYETGRPAYPPGIFGPPPPPDEWLANPQQHYESLLKHWNMPYK